MNTNPNFRKNLFMLKEESEKGKRINKHVKTILIEIIEEIEKEKALNNEFYNEANKYTNIFHGEIYRALGFEYKRMMINGTDNKKEDPNYHANLVLYRLTEVDGKYNKQHVEIAKKLNNTDSTNETFWFWQDSNYTFHPINCNELFKLLDIDKEENNIRLEYSFSDTCEGRRYIKVNINKEDYNRLANEAYSENEAKKK